MAAASINNSNQLVFSEKPGTLYVDEDRSAKPPPYGKIDLLVNNSRLKSEAFS